MSRIHNVDEIEDPETVGFDKTSSKKGHSYVSTMVDIKQRKVLYASSGKGADNITESVNYLKEKSVEVEDFKQACIDMSPAFISGRMEHLPNAAITFDKFHVIKEVNVSRAVYNVLAIDKDGYKDLIGMYVSESEGANFWLRHINRS